MTFRSARSTSPPTGREIVRDASWRQRDADASAAPPTTTSTCPTWRSSSTRRMTRDARAAHCASRRSARSASPRRARRDQRDDRRRARAPNSDSALPHHCHRATTTARSPSPCAARNRTRRRRRRGLRGFSLASALPGKRAIAWALLVVILVAFLAVPICRTSPARRRTEDRPAGRSGDGRELDARPAEPAHHGLEGNCEACHVKAFVAVRDKACLACHKDIGDHADHARLVARPRPARAWATRFQRAVADTVPQAGPGRLHRLPHRAPGRRADGSRRGRNSAPIATARSTSG